MFNLAELVSKGVSWFFSSFFSDFIKFFATTLSDIMSTSQNVLQMPLVQNGTLYAQGLAFTILVLKAGSEAFNTYILYQNGDPDADPTGLLIRTAQASAIIACLPWLIEQIFTFGTDLCKDVAGLSSGATGVKDWSFITALITSTGGTVITGFFIVIAIMMLVVAIQATIRGAELALMSILGPIMALNLTANNRSVWSAWIRQAIIICCSQAIQIFMLSGALALLTSQAISSGGLLLVFGWMWVTVKSPKYVQQFAYSTGLSSAVGGTAKQAGTMVAMRMMLRAG